MIRSIIEKNGFALSKVTPIAEMQGQLWEMEHPKSGAKLVWLDRPDENMTFAIGFQTIPTDSTGVFHILEHSVLGGSEKYPVREPFVELLKSSLQTFLNAMTFPDKTVYPFSSRNKQDFRNLMGIYMDAVLHPTAVKHPNIFRQEGWRLELPEDGAPMFQGVVYNEMKGAFSDVREVAQNEMTSRLFRDTCYRHEAGGDPSVIPDLTYEQFCQEHAKYYHPSNARIVLDGQVDLDGCLGFLNGCLSEYDRQEMVFPIEPQQPCACEQVEVPYEIGAGEDTANRTIISYGKLLCSYEQPETIYAANILADYLTGGSEAPLKRAILDAGLGEDMSFRVHDGTLQSWVGWQVWNTEADRLPQIRQVIRDTVQGIVERGLDPERLQGCFNSLAFQLMDRDGAGYPRGLMETITIYESWLYDGDPAQNLAYRSVLDSLQRKLGTGWFEQLLSHCLLEDSTGVLVTLVPSRTLGQERVQREQERAAAYWAGLDEAARADLRAELETLHIWQQTPDTPEQLATIPMLKLADVTGGPTKPVMHRENAAGTQILVHEMASDLVYTDLFFEASDLTAQELPMVNLLCSVLGQLQTGSHTGAQLQTLTRQKIGDLSFSAEFYPVNPEAYRAVLSVRSVCLPAFGAEGAELLLEILTGTRFTECDTVRNILRQEKNANQRRLVSSGNRYAASRVFARETAAGAAREYYSGCEYIRWVIGTAECSDAELETLLARLAALAEKLFVRSRLTVSVSGNAQSMAERIAGAFPEGTAAPQQGAVPTLAPCSEGILIPAGVGFAAKGGNLNKVGGSFCGSAYALCNLLTFEHLWNAVRVQGGAYGTGFRIGESGDVIATSFRDPSPCKSLGHFDACADVVENICRENRDMTKFILGALSDMDPLLGAAGKLQLAEKRFFLGTEYDEVCRVYQELLSTDAGQLLSFCESLRAVAKGGNFCIVGGKEQLDACGDKLDTVLDIFA